MIALDDLRPDTAAAQVARLEALVEDIRKTLEGPSSAAAKIDWIKELLAVQGYRVGDLDR